MGRIQDLLRQILSATYGRDVRQSIHDAIEQCYTDVTTGKTTAETAATAANTAATNATNTVADAITEAEAAITPIMTAAQAAGEAAAEAAEAATEAAASIQTAINTANAAAANCDRAVEAIPDIPENLSDLLPDGTHQTVTDAEKQVWNGKQNALVSGVSIKTINNQSLLGAGNIPIEGGKKRGVAVVFGDSIFDCGTAQEPIKFANYLRKQGIYSEVRDFARSGTGFGRTYDDEQYEGYSLYDMLLDSTSPRYTEARQAVQDAEVIYMHLGGNDMMSAAEGSADEDIITKITACFDEIFELNPAVIIKYVPFIRLDNFDLLMRAFPDYTDEQLQAALTVFFEIMAAVEMLVGCNIKSADITSNASIRIRSDGMHPDNMDAALNLYEGIVYGGYSDSSFSLPFTVAVAVDGTMADGFLPAGSEELMLMFSTINTKLLLINYVTGVGMTYHTYDALANTQDHIEWQTEEPGKSIKLDSSGFSFVQRESISSVHNYDNTGRNLKQIFGTAAALHTAVAAGDFSNIQVGDYWDLAISGTYRDFGSYTCPAGTQLYSDTALTQTAGTASNALEAKYVDDTYCQVSQSGTKYCRTIACLAYYERTVNLPAERFRVAGINSFMGQNVNNWNDSLRSGNHILFVYENSLDQSMRFRRQATTWRQPPANDLIGHWNGSDLFATLNDPTYGIIKLMEQTDLGSYIFSGSEGRGLQYIAFGRSNTTSTSVSNNKASYRGRLFIPTYDELGYHTGVYEQGLKTWALYNGTSKFSRSHDRNIWVDYTAGWAPDRGFIFAYSGQPLSNLADKQYTVRFAFIFQ